MSGLASLEVGISGSASGGSFGVEEGQILMTGDVNGHSYLWGSHDVDIRGEVIERFTDKTICVFSMTEPTLI